MALPGYPPPISPARVAAIIGLGKKLKTKGKPGSLFPPLGSSNGSGSYVVGSNSGGGPLTAAQIQAQAQAQADAELAAEQAVIARQQQAAAAKAAADEAALRGLSEAQVGMLAPLPAEIAAIQAQGGAAIAGYGQGYSGAVRGDIQQAQGQDAATVAAQTGGTAAGAPTIDPNAVSDAMYAMGGAIPATETTSVGVASANAAAGMPAVVARAATEDIMQRMAEAASTDADYRQQLIDLNTKRPGLVQDAIDRLQAIEDKKRQAALDERQMSLQERAELVQEAALGNKNAQARLKAQNDKAKLKLAKQTLKLKAAKQAADIAKAEREGRQPDAALSKVYGYVVDSNGQPILDASGNKIGVVQSAQDKAGGRKAAVQKATGEARTLRGKPVAAPKTTKHANGTLGPPAGKYTARRGAKGILGDGTTNDPNKAARDGGMTFQQAQSYLMHKYGLSRADARAALISTGWRPGT